MCCFANGALGRDCGSLQEFICVCEPRDVSVKPPNKSIIRKRPCCTSDNQSTYNTNAMHTMYIYVYLSIHIIIITYICTIGNIGIQIYIYMCRRDVKCFRFAKTKQTNMTGQGISGLCPDNVFVTHGVATRYLGEISLQDYVVVCCAFCGCLATRQKLNMRRYNVL